jgi:adenylate cyclase
MGKPKLLLGVALLSGMISTAQDLDSLRAVWNDSLSPDSERAYSLEDLIWGGYVYSNMDSALILSDTLLAFTRRKGLRKFVARHTT